MAPDFLALRKRLRLTQGEAAALFGVDRRSWQNWEAGKTAPGPALVLARLLADDLPLAERIMARHPSAC
jgi:DNA-binding transcriptional regulator YiaG